MNKDFEDGQKAMAKDMIFYIRRHLGPDMALNTKLSSKIAYAFAIDFVKVLEIEFLKND